MTDKQRDAYRKVFADAAKRRPEPSYTNHKIAHQDEKIAHPNTMRKLPATILLVVMLIGSFIFEQWYFIWIIALVWYFSKKRV